MPSNKQDWQDINWIKISTALPDNEKIKLIEKLPEGDTLIVLWIKMIIHAGKINNNGYIYLVEGVPYSDEELATVYNRPLPVVRMALEIFSRLRMIEIFQDGGINLINWEKYQNVEGMEKIRAGNADRQRRLRMKMQYLLPPVTDNVTLQVTSHNGTDKIREDILEEKLRDLYKKNINILNFNTYYNGLKVLGYVNSNVVIGFPDEAAAAYVEQNGMDMLRRLLFSLACDYEPKIVLLESEE